MRVNRSAGRGCPGWVVVAIGVGLAFVASVAGAQTGLARVKGTAADTQGGALPGATVVVENLATGQKFETTTSGTGFYLLPALIPGDYEVTVTLDGMRTWTAKIKLATGDDAQLDATLSVGGLTEVVEVTGEAAPLLNTSSPTLANVMENERVQQLPLNGRDVQGLILQTTAGLDGNANNPRLFGLRDATTEYVMDGVVLNSRFNGSITSIPALDSVNELRVETNLAPAKAARPGSITISSKSGANRFAGSLFWTNRDNRYGVARAREDAPGAPVPKLRRNEFGGAIGGPIVRNRSFFYATYEEYHRDQDTSRITNVPTQAMRNGDFSEARNAAGQLQVVYNPFTTGPGPTHTRQAFPGNQVPMSLLSPLAKWVLDRTPLPTLPDVNPLVAPNYYGYEASTEDKRRTSVRLDHRLSNKDTVFLRYSYSKEDNLRPDNDQGLTAPILRDTGSGEILANIFTGNSTRHNVATSWTRVLSPALFVETTASYAYMYDGYYEGYPKSEANVQKELGLPNPLNLTGFGVIRDTGLAGTSVWGPIPQYERMSTWAVDQNWSTIAGRHQIETGWHLRRDSVETLPRQFGMRGTVGFNSFATSLYNTQTGTLYNPVPNTGLQFANFFLGAAAYYDTEIRRQEFGAQNWEVAGYAQDTWEFTRDLTLAAGLRYEFFSPFEETNGESMGFDMATQTLILGKSTQQLIAEGKTSAAAVAGYNAVGAKFATPADIPGFPSSFVKTSHYDFSPRVGFAWAPSALAKKMVLRGGYGLYRYPIPTRTFYQPMRGAHPYTYSPQANWNGSSFSPDGQNNWLIRNAPTVIAGRNSSTLIDLNSKIVIGTGIQTDAMEVDQKTASAHQWNLTAEYEVMKNTLAGVSYVGTAGRNFEQWWVYNHRPTDYVWYTTTRMARPADANAIRTINAQRGVATYGEERFYTRNGYSDFDGLTLQLQRRYTKGLAAHLMYTYSRAFGTGQAPSNAGYYTGNDSINAVYPEPSAFLPGALPTDPDELVRFLTYRQDRNNVPVHHFRWNLLVDLPFGKGKKIARNATGVLNAILGGWQLAGSGRYLSRYFAAPTNNWGTLGDIEVYGTKYKIKDCTSGRCYDGYLWYNGYLPANRINTPNGYLGVPESYRPSHQPVNPVQPDGTGSGNNNTTVLLANGAAQSVSADDGLHPWRKRAIEGPWSFFMDATLSKYFGLRGRTRLQLRLDAFNVFNYQGIPLPDVNTGIILLNRSENTPRQLQFTARFTF